MPTGQKEDFPNPNTAPKNAHSHLTGLQLNPCDSTPMSYGRRDSHSQEIISLLVQDRLPQRRE